MTQTKEDLNNIKSKLLSHIKSTYDKSKADEMVIKIEGMNDNEFIQFLKTQGLIAGDKTNSDPNCVFCSMISGNIPTTKIGENNSAICILELNPVSIGHSMIIPKSHVTKTDELPKEVHDLADTVIDDLLRTFKPQRIDKIHSNVMGHEIINLIPVFNSENMDSPRNKETPEGLLKTKEQILNSKPKQIELPEKPKQIEEVEKEQEEINEDNTWLPKRIP